MYKVYGAVPTRAFRVLWLLEELGEPYELIIARPQSDVIRAKNPAGKVPALEVGGEILTDSVAIMSYLADKHGKFTYPAGTIARAHQDALLHTLVDEFDALLWTAARYGALLPEEHRVPEIAPSLKWEFARNLERMADRFVGPFLQGEQMTIADILLVHCLNWAFAAEFPVENEKMKSFGKVMRARAAYRRAQQAGS
ncbi:glutathione S-transferase family protein [Arenibacterium sp. CAU 1754]